MALDWVTEFVDDRIITPLHRKHLDYYVERQLLVREGVARALDRDILSINVEFEKLPDFLVGEKQDPGMMTKWSATSELAATTYAIIKLLQPELVVETGVGAGVSSWTILKAMDENNKGKLISIDLPTPNTELLPQVGYLVPSELRYRWDLRTGSSQRFLPLILEEMTEIDVFLHDSRHSYSNQLLEYQTAWPYIRSGGMLISDDVSNDALYDATRLWGWEPIIIGQSKESPIGLIRKQ